MCYIIAHIALVSLSLISYISVFSLAHVCAGGMGGRGGGGGGSRLDRERDGNGREEGYMYGALRMLKKGLASS